MLALIAVIASLIAGFIIYKIEQSKFHGQSDFDEEDDESKIDCNLFDFLTVNEQFAEAKVTNDELMIMQGLISDLSMCNIDNQIIVQISWTDSDGNTNTYDLYCDGINTASECLAEIATREVAELRSTLSEQCSMLARSTQGTTLLDKKRNAERKIRKLSLGEAKKMIQELVGDDKYDSGSQSDADPK